MYRWERIKDLLPGKAADRGVTAKDNRLFVEAVLWRDRTGSLWRDLPAKTRIKPGPRAAGDRNGPSRP